MASGGSSPRGHRLPTASGHRGRSRLPLQARLFRLDPQATFFGDASGDEFGTSLDLGRVTLVVGAPLADEAALVDAGEVYVFRRDSNQLWGTAARLRASDGDPGDRFGHSVALSLPGVLVGAPNASGSTGENDAGAVYHFEGQGDAIFVGDFESGTTARWSNAVASMFRAAGSTAVVHVHVPQAVGRERAGAER